jgi:Icc-related predicted phosphoesterase
MASALADSLSALDTDVKVALTHYSPIKETVLGETPEIFAFLGSYRLSQAIDAGRVDLALHGHAHHGKEKGITASGIPVRNVAMPLLRRPYALFHLPTRALTSALTSAPPGPEVSHR